MIDTVAFISKITREQFLLITKRSKELTIKDNELNAIKYHGVKAELKIGSFDSNINIQCDETTARIEFSLPKQYLGNNVELLYPPAVPEALTVVQDHLRNYYGDFPSYLDWRLIRLDLCYAWKWPDIQMASRILEVLKTFDFPRKVKIPYPTSVMWRGRHYTLKFYLKNEEFVRNELQRNKDKFQKDTTDFTERMLKLSEGVLRYEITLRKQMLNYLFGKKASIRL